jgi:hypothetical protein
MKLSQFFKNPFVRFFSAMIALIIVGLSLHIWWPPTTSDSETSQPAYEAERYAYEQALLEDPRRITADSNLYIDDSELFVKERSTALGECDYRCMVVEQVESGYAVTLPVAFNYAPGTLAEPLDSLGNIVELTYWDSQDHQAKTLTVRNGDTVRLPAVLYDVRHLEDIGVGEGAYTSVAFIRHDGDPSQRVLIYGMSIRDEPGGEFYGLADLTYVERTESGFNVCLPDGYTADDLIDSDASGYTATILKNC